MWGDGGRPLDVARPSWRRQVSGGGRQVTEWRHGHVTSRGLTKGFEVRGRTGVRARAYGTEESAGPGAGTDRDPPRGSRFVAGGRARAVLGWRRAASGHRHARHRPGAAARGGRCRRPVRVPRPVTRDRRGRAAGGGPARRGLLADRLGGPRACADVRVHRADVRRRRVDRGAPGHAKPHVVVGGRADRGRGSAGRRRAAAHRPSSGPGHRADSGDGHSHRRRADRDGARRPAGAR